MCKYRATSHTRKKHTKAHRQSTLAKTKDKNTEIIIEQNTMTGCITTNTKRHISKY